MITTDTRTELLQLAQDVTAGEVRRGFADCLVPLVASPHCLGALAVFAALTEAVAAGEDAETNRLLDVLTQGRAA